jgi:superoxide dismutase
MLNFLDVYFGGYDNFKKLWKEVFAEWLYLVNILVSHSQACHSLFGSGWVWLVDNDGFYEILPSQNSGMFRSFFSILLRLCLLSGTPVGIRAMEPVLCINLWEHAYFFDYGHDKDVCAF